MLAAWYCVVAVLLNISDPSLTPSHLSSAYSCYLLASRYLFTALSCSLPMSTFRLGSLTPHKCQYLLPRFHGKTFISA